MKIRSNPVGTPIPRTNYEQTDPTKADYLNGKEALDKKIENLQTAADDNNREIKNLDNDKAETATYKGTFSSDGWSGSAPYTQTITVNGILSTDYPFVDIDLSNVSNASEVIEAWAMVGRCTVSADNTVIAYCYEDKPTVNIPIIFKVVR